MTPSILSPDNLFDRRSKQAAEERDLAPYGMRSAASAGRARPEPEDELRTAWERDRDRIVHSTAFRRLMYKTQVFVNWEGDHYRTRLSHTLEVCQVARSLACALGLNEPLTEAIALAHDIGHPPFGHRGERALNELMASHGGFRHNAQVLRVVDRLERRSPLYPGLNLTREVRVGLLKHEVERDWPAGLLPRPSQPVAEAQAVDLSDSTAYDVHDLQDGLAAGMFQEPQLREEVALWREGRESVERRSPGFLRSTRDQGLVVRRITNDLLKICINDLIHASARRLSEGGFDSPGAVQAASAPVVVHGEELSGKVAELTRFLHARFYHHPHLQQLSEHAVRTLEALFRAYVSRPDEMAPWYLTWMDEVGVERAACDYIAGMTDRFAEQEYERLAS